MKRKYKLRKKLPSKMDLVALTLSIEVKDGVKIPVITMCPVTSAATKRYHNSMKVLLGLSGCARDFLDYSTEHMDEMAVISTDKHMVDRFKEFVKQVSGYKLDYSEYTIRKAITTLRQRGVFLTNTRGTAKVCPIFFSNYDNEGRRLNDIEATFKFSDKDGKPNDRLEVIASYLNREGIQELVKVVNGEEVINQIKELKRSESKTGR